MMLFDQVRQFASKVSPCYRALLIASILLLSSGCATTLSYDPSVLRFDVPETSGDLFAGSAEVQLGVTGTRVMAERNQGFMGNEIDSSSIAYRTQTPTTGVRANAGLAKPIDVYVRSMVDTPNVIGAKYQLVGDADKSMPGWRVTFSTEYGHYQQSEDEGDSQNIEVDYYDYSINVGFRLDPHWLLYVNNFYSRYNIEGSLGRDVRTKSTINGMSKGFGQLIGVRYQLPGKNKKTSWLDKPYVTLEIGNSALNWLSTNDNDGNRLSSNQHLNNVDRAIGLSVGFSWK